MPKNERKAGEARCTKCREYYPKHALNKVSSGGLLCDGCVLAMGRRDAPSPLGSGMAAAAGVMTAALLAGGARRKPKIEVSGEPKLDLSDE